MAGGEECDRLSSLGILGEDEMNNDENLLADGEVEQILNTQQRSPSRQHQQRVYCPPPQTRPSLHQQPPCPFSPIRAPSPPLSQRRRPYEPVGLAEPLVPTKLYGRSRLPEPLQPTRVYHPQTSITQNDWCTPQDQPTQDLIYLGDGFPGDFQQSRPQTPLSVGRRFPLPRGPRRQNADTCQGVESFVPLEGVEMTTFPETGDPSCPPENFRWPTDYPFSDRPNLVAPWAAEDAAPDFDPYYTDPPDPCSPRTPQRRPQDENTILLELLNQEEQASPIDDLQERLSQHTHSGPYQLQVHPAWRRKVHVAPAYAKSDGYPETVDEDQEAERRQSDQRDHYQVRLSEGDPISELRAEMLSRPWSERPGFSGETRPAGARTTPQRPRGQRSQSPGSPRSTRPAGGQSSLTQEFQTAEEVRNLILQTRARLDKILKRNC